MRYFDVCSTEIFDKAMKCMEAEQAFFEASAKWAKVGRRLAKAMAEVEFISADVAIEAADDEVIANRLAKAKYTLGVAERDFEVAAREYEEAVKKWKALPKDVLQAKEDLKKCLFAESHMKSLDDCNLILVNIDGQDKLRPISECEINGKVYKCDFSNADEENYITAKELFHGCVMTIRNQKKTYLIRAFGIRKLNIYVWEIPYKEDGEYSVSEAFEVMKSNYRCVFNNIPTERPSVSRFWGLG